VIATAARDHGHADGPAGPIWGVWTPRSGDIRPRRYRLAELPARGPHVEHSAPSANQPFSEAAFDPNDPEMLRRIDTPQPEPVGSPGYPDDDDDLTVYDDTDEDGVYRAPVAPAWPNTQQPRRWAA
jgi:hypothetical protein